MTFIKQNKLLTIKIVAVIVLFSILGIGLTYWYQNIYQKKDNLPATTSEVKKEEKIEVKPTEIEVNSVDLSSEFKQQLLSGKVDFNKFPKPWMVINGYNQIQIYDQKNQILFPFEGSNQLANYETNLNQMPVIDGKQLFISYNENQIISLNFESGITKIFDLPFKLADLRVMNGKFYITENRKQECNDENGEGKCRLIEFDPENNKTKVLYSKVFWGRYGSYKPSLVFIERDYFWLKDATGDACQGYSTYMQYAFTNSSLIKSVTSKHDCGITAITLTNSKNQSKTLFKYACTWGEEKVESQINCFSEDPKDKENVAQKDKEAKEIFAKQLWEGYVDPNDQPNQEARKEKIICGKFTYKTTEEKIFYNQNEIKKPDFNLDRQATCLE